MHHLFTRGDLTSGFRDLSVCKALGDPEVRISLLEAE